MKNFQLIGRLKLCWRGSYEGALPPVAANGLGAVLFQEALLVSKRDNKCRSLIPGSRFIPGSNSLHNSSRYHERIYKYASDPFPPMLQQRQNSPRPRLQFGKHPNRCSVSPLRHPDTRSKGLPPSGPLAKQATSRPWRTSSSLRPRGRRSAARRTPSTCSPRRRHPRIGHGGYRGLPSRSRLLLGPSHPGRL